MPKATCPQIGFAVQAEARAKAPVEIALAADDTVDATAPITSGATAAPASPTVVKIAIPA
jgi:hypothetical protein